VAGRRAASFTVRGFGEAAGFGFAKAAGFGEATRFGAATRFGDLLGCDEPLKASCSQPSLADLNRQQHQCRHRGDDGAMAGPNTQARACEFSP